MSDFIVDLLRSLVIEPSVARAAAAGVAVWSGGRWEVEVGACGHTGLEEASPETVFDLASLTKPFVALAFARLVDRGELRPEQRLEELVDEASKTPGGASSLEALFCHRSGLAAHHALFAPLERGCAFDRRRALLQASRASREARDEERSPFGFSALYSDLGYLLGGEALARSARVALDALVEREVTAPLGLGARSARQWLAAGADFIERAAPTENVPSRGGELRGVVHDENAWAFAGHALAGHAGLFGRVRDVLGLGVAVLDSLANRSVTLLSRPRAEWLLAERPGGSWRVGFDGKSDSGSSAGPSASSRTFGHLGFTGTSVWCDPMAETVTVLLTNRVCPTRENTAIRACRPRVHEALFQRGRALARRSRRPGAP
jgi:CubicO group peptidase (beta-lactamase class C family)